MPKQTSSIIHAWFVNCTHYQNSCDRPTNLCWKGPYTESNKPGYEAWSSSLKTLKYPASLPRNSTSMAIFTHVLIALIHVSICHNILSIIMHYFIKVYLLLYFRKIMMHYFIVAYLLLYSQSNLMPYFTIRYAVL